MDVFGVVASGQERYLRDAVARAAADLGLAGAATAGKFADNLCLPNARRLRRLLDALALFGLARREGEVFHVVATKPAGPVPDGGWGQLADVIRTDRPLSVPDELARFHDYLFQTAAEPARELWQKLALRGPLLDLGGGAGGYSAAFEGDATVADLPAVLALSKAPRAKLLPLDLLHDEYPGGFGVVLLANVLHLFAEPDCRAIVRKAAGALTPGGLLIVKDLFVESDRSGPAEGVLFALNMALYTDGGDVHDAPAIERWLREAGLAPARRLTLTSSPGALVLSAAKP